MKVISFCENEFEENAYVIIRDKDVTIIDPGFNFDSIDNYLTEHDLLLTRVLLTHGHADHIGELNRFIKKYDFKIYINELDVPFLNDEDLNCAKGLGLHVSIKNAKNIVPINDLDEVEGFIFYHTPGHTQGSSIIRLNNMLFTGDTLFKGSIGRSDLPTGSLNDLTRSLKFIVSSFPKEIIVLPGHNEKTTLGEEIKKNQYIKTLKKDGKG